MSFTATYGGVCAHRCEHGIRPGDTIQATAAWPGYVHVDCPEPANELEVTRDPCPSCFTVPAANGTCGCEP